MENNKQAYTVNRFFLLAIILLIAGGLLWSLMDFFTAFLAAVMFYVLSKPLVDFLIRRWHWKKSFAALLVIFISFFIILLPIGVIATMLYEKIIGITQNPAVFIKPVKSFGEMIQARYKINIVSSSIGNIQSFATQVVSSVVNTSFNFFTTITMMYFFLYFMIVSTNRMEASLMLYLPFKRSQMKVFTSELRMQTFTNAVVVPLIILIHGILLFIAYLISGVQDASFWCVISGFASIIPLVGTSLIWMPIALYLLSQGHIWQGIFLITWGLIVIGFSDNIVRFALAKKMADVHPVVTVLGVIIGLRYFGITGLIFGPLIISYFLILLKIYYVEYQRPSQKEGPSKTKSATIV